MVASELRRRISDGDVSPGELLSQGDLATSLGVSRVPIRDALQWLASIGLVCLNGRAGATVAPLSVVDLEEIYDLRAILEPKIIRLAVPNLGRADLHRTANEMKAMESAESRAEWLRHNCEFHTSLYRAAARPRMLGTIEVLRMLMDRYFIVSAPTLDMNVSNAEHAAIHEAACSRDGDAASRLTAEHLSSSYDTLIARLLESDFFDSPVAIKHAHQQSLARSAPS